MMQNRSIRSRRWRVAVPVVAAVLAFASAAQAQEKKATVSAPSAPPKTKVYDFSGDKIEGDLIRPDGSTIDARDFAKHASLIRVRKDFIPEIVKSAEDL